ncbi:hypothetical protein [Saccharothrix obliqua]|uniref:hypothetical protein n=1 Tax=Saccharothrix obliqua TaxID=2861747 RepID=UPI001C5D1E2B|nr:hypothetical protein [Saccharothrix obliqua]MBW4722434.1 hypothetical protein [Saccharothrix obliqua]
MDSPAESLPWVEPTFEDLEALTLHLRLQQMGSVHSGQLDAALDRRLESLLLLEAGIAAAGGRRDRLAVRLARRLINRTVTEFLQGSTPSKTAAQAVSA